jgi:hypothetical protein
MPFGLSICPCPSIEGGDCSFERRGRCCCHVTQSCLTTTSAQSTPNDNKASSNLRSETTFVQRGLVHSKMDFLGVTGIMECNVNK